MAPLRRRGSGCGRPAECLLLILFSVTQSLALSNFCAQYFPGADPTKLKGVSLAAQGGTSYNWGIDLCEPFDPFYKCQGEKPIWLGQSTESGSCAAELQCSGFPEVNRDERTNSVVYSFGSENCKKVSFQHRIAKMYVSCKSEGKLKVTSVQANGTPNGGYAYEIYVEVECGNVPPAPGVAPLPAPGGSPEGDVKPATGGGFDFGWLFVIFFLLGVVGYFGGFIGYNMKRKGMSLGESIPHKEFWKDLPGLVWDGMKFTGGGMVTLSNKVRKK